MNSLVDAVRSTEGFVHLRYLSIASGIIVLLGVVVALFSTGTGSLLTFGALMGQPGMIATILDVYAGIAFFSAWVCFRENAKEHLWTCVGWVTLFVLTGNIGTAVYLFQAALKAGGDYEVLLFGNRRFEFQH